MRTALTTGLLVVGLCANGCSTDGSGAAVGEVESAEASLVGPNGISASLGITSLNFGGYCARVTVKNDGLSATSSWTAVLDLGSERVTRSSDAVLEGSAGLVTAKSTASNGTVSVGSSARFTFCASGSFLRRARLAAVSATFGEGGTGGGTGGSGATTTGGSGGVTTTGGSGGAITTTTGGSGGATTPTGGSGATGSTPMPQLPAITGTCPTFTTGTATIGGLGGIALQVGPRKQGTGSLLFYWHGTGSSSSEVNSLVPSAVRQDLLNQGGIIVSFQSSVGTGGDCSGTSTFSKDDFKIADLIAACAVRDHGIDPRRIYTTGCSAGGLQAGCMGALRSSYIAAAVPNSGGEVTKLAIQDPKHIPAVMTLHGGASDVVGVSFASTSAAYDAQMDTAGGFVVNCNHGGGHCRAPAALYSAGWEFMKAHPFGVAPEPYSASLPGTFPSYCAKY